MKQPIRTFTLAAMYAVAQLGQAYGATSKQSATSESLMTKYQWTPLMQAAHRGDAERLQELLASKTNVNAVSRDGETALLAALLEPRKEVAYDDRNAYVNNNRSLVGMQPLPSDWSETDFTVGNGACNISCVQLLIRAGANVNAADRYGRTALREAVDQGQSESVKALLDAKANVNSKDKEADTPLLQAIRLGQTECARTLLEAGADPNVVDKSGMSPLMWAAATSNLEGYKLLLGKGANPKLKNQFGESVVTKAIGVIWSDEPSVRPTINVPTFPHVTPGLTVDQAIAFDRALAQKPSPTASPARMMNLGGSRILVPGYSTPPNPGQGAFNRMMVANQMQQTASLNQLSAVSGELGALALQTFTSLFRRHEAVKYPVTVGVASPEALKVIASDGADVNARSAFDGATPLLTSIESGRIETAKVLLSSGADAKITDKDGNSPLQAAALLGNADLLNQLISRHADVNEVTKSGLTALHLACFVNPINAEKIVNAAIATVPGADAGIYQAVLREADYGACVKFLMDHKANVNAKTRTGQTPLMIALQGGNSEAASILVNNGADLKITDAEGMTILHYAVVGGDRDIVKKLIDRGADVNRPGKGGFTSLMLASEGGDEGIVEALLSAGATVSARSQNGWTALIGAAREGNEACVAKLLAAGADANYATPLGQTALIMAAGFGHGKCVETLLKAGAGVHAQLKDGTTPLIAAGAGGDSTAIAALLSSGANPNEALSDGRSALSIACRTGHDNCASTLIDAGANINSVDKDHKTPLMIAATAGRPSCVKLLLRKGADATMKAHGQTALQLAQEAARRNPGQPGYREVIDALSRPGATK